jgi:putative transposase
MVQISSRDNQIQSHLSICNHMSDEIIYHRRHLPHYYLRDAVYFVTFCLAGSLPRVRVLDLTSERRALKGRKEIGSFHSRPQVESFEGYIKDLEWIDKILDRANSQVLWLADPRVANIVSDALRERDTKEYDLAAFSIMPNHVHVVFGLGHHGLFEQDGQINNLSYKTPSKILGSLKRYTAKEANRVVARTGKFWQDESYDHVVRDEKEFESIVQYTVNNPVKAGFVENWHEWKWTYSKFDM